MSEQNLKVDGGDEETVKEMTRRIKYLPGNVYEEARKRIKYTLAAYDHVFVSFSGGKDSLAVLWLTRMIMDEMGMKDRPVRVMFRDEEVIPDPVIDFVQSFHGRPGFELIYLACPMKSHVFVLGEHRPYIQWDESREWIRPKPPYAITKVHPEDKPLDQHEMNALTFLHLGIKGKIAVLNGIRADESLMRLRACTIKKGKLSWIAKDGHGSKVSNIDFCKPIYDWTQNDIFKFFYEHKIEYAPIYDTQLYSGEQLRVGTPLHDRAYQSMVRLRTTYPRFFEQIVAIWPEIVTHELYWSQVDRWAVIDKYPPSWGGIFQYIEDKIDGEASQAKAKKEVLTVRRMKENYRRLGKYVDACYGFPLLYVWREVVSGRYTKGISNLPKASDAELEYEEKHLAYLEKMGEAD